MDVPHSIQKQTSGFEVSTSALCQKPTNQVVRQGRSAI